LAYVLYTLGLLATVGAALAAVPRIWQVLRWSYHLLRRVDELSRLVPVILGMAQQFQRDGGSSMRDAVAAIKEDVAGVKTDVAALKEQTNGQDDVLAGISDRLQKVEQLNDVVSEMRRDMDRFIVHKANDDLGNSKLREELERKLANEPKAPETEGDGPPSH